MKRFPVSAIALLLLLACPALAAPNRQPAPAAGDKCAVCGMFVAKYPAWACMVLFRDGSAAWFDGAKDLFTFYFDIGKYAPGKTRFDVKSMLVKDYYSTGFVEAEKAVYVVGSDVTGPMGSELVPFGKPADAQAFMKDHKGRKALRAHEVTPAALKALP